MEPHPVIEGMSRELVERALSKLDAKLAESGGLFKTMRDELAGVVLAGVTLGIEVERARVKAEAARAMPAAMRAALVREDSLDMWCAHSSSEGEAYALAGSREECRDELIRLREQGDEGGFAEAVASVDHALDHGDVFIARCAVRVAWVNDGDEHEPTPAWLDTVPA